MAMTFPVNGGGGDFKQVPAGTHIAVCHLVADMGMQPGSGQYPDPKHQIYFRFEVPGERVQYERDGKQLEGPRTIGQFFTASMNAKAKLRHSIEGWYSRKFTDDEAAAFDVSQTLGKACMLTVVETNKDGKSYSNIVSISALPKGIEVPKAENPLLLYSNDTPETLDKLPQWLRDKINNQVSLDDEVVKITQAYASKPVTDSQKKTADQVIASITGADELGDSVAELLASLPD